MYESNSFLLIPCWIFCRKTDPHVPAENTGGQAVALRKKQGRKRKPRSDVWKHYEPFTNSNGEERARCNKCGLDLAADTSKNGTSRLRRHIQGSCPGSPAPPKPPAAAAAAQSQSLDCSSKPADSDWEEATADLARMIASHSYDTSFVEDSNFRSFVRRLNPGFQVPSRDAIQVSCDGIFEETMRVLESELERTSGQVNLALDTAETAQGTVLYVACHFIDEGWNHRQMIIDAYLVAPEYMSRMPLLGTGGVVLYGTDRYNVLVERISNHAVLDRLFSITVGRIGGLRTYLEKASFQAACGGVSSCYGDTYADTLLCSVAEHLCDNLRSHLFASDPEEMVEGEPGLEFEELRSQLDFDCRPPYHKKWYSCYSSLQAFQKYSSSEFDKLLCRLWREIDGATKTISDPSHPTSNIVLRELFKAREKLQAEIDQASREHLYGGSNCFVNDVAAVLATAKDNLDLGIQNSYLKWSIPFALDPRYKLKFIAFIFNRAFSSSGEEYVCKVKQEMSRLFTSFSKDGRNPNHATEETADSAHELEQAWDAHCRPRHKRFRRSELVEGQHIKLPDTG